MDLVSGHEWCLYTPDKPYEGLKSNIQDTFCGANGHNLAQYPHPAPFPDCTQPTVSFSTPKIISAQVAELPVNGSHYAYHQISATAAQELAPAKSAVSVSQQGLESST